MVKKKKDTEKKEKEEKKEVEKSSAEETEDKASTDQNIKTSQDHEEVSTEDTEDKTSKQQSIKSSQDHRNTKTRKHENSEDEREEETEKVDLSSQLGKGEIIQLDVEESSGSGFNMKKIGTILIVVLLIAGIGGGVYYFFLRNGGTKSAGPIEEVPVTEEGAETTADAKDEESTSEADVEKSGEEDVDVVLSDYSVEVLNGSGVAGEAGAVSDLLEEEGFDEISAGNADSYDYTDTEVRMKENIPEKVFDSIKEALSAYTVVRKDDLSDDSDYDVQIIVGQKK